MTPQQIDEIEAWVKADSACPSYMVKPLLALIEKARDTSRIDGVASYWQTRYATDPISAIERARKKA